MGEADGFGAGRGGGAAAQPRAQLQIQRPSVPRRPPPCPGHALFSPSAVMWPELHPRHPAATVFSRGPLLLRAPVSTEPSEHAAHETVGLVQAL
eukprot:1744106-Rhodomonas_salina.1